MDAMTLTLPNEANETVCYRGGSGEALLYLHHLAGMQGWEQVHEQLARSFDVIAPYHPGFGPTADAVDFANALDLVLHYRALLEALNVSQVHVLGHSIGAWIGAELAAIYPERVKRMVLLNPVGLWDDDLRGEDPYAQAPMAATAVLLADPSRREELILHNGTVEATENYVQEMKDLKASARFLWPVPDTGVARRLPLVQTPTLVVTSVSDRVVPVAYGEIWKGHITGASAITIEGGHLVNLEDPERVASVATNFFHGAE
jgi:pimeloyl-ACP methyl ester carboxylesterase